MEQIKTLFLSPFKGKQSSIFTGRPEGRAARQKLKLSELDGQKGVIFVLDIPEGTTSFNPSFYLGLLFDSFKTLGPDGFDRKYRFNINSKDDQTRRVLEKNLADGKRNALNSFLSKNAFTSSL